MPNDYYNIIDSISEGVVVLNDKGQITYANPRFCDLFEYNATDVLKIKIEDLIPSEYSAHHKQHRVDFTKNPKLRSMSEGGVFSAMTKRGKELKVSIGLNAGKDQEGNKIIVATITDCTEKEKLHRTLETERKRAIQFLNLSKSLFLWLDKNGKVKMINPAGLELLEYEESEVVNKNWFQNFVEEDDADWLKGVFTTILEEKVQGVEFVQSNVICKSGVIKLIEWHNSTVHDEDGQPDGTISSGVDVSLRENSEKARTEAILLGIEQERKRIAGELHDGLVQTLSAISLNLKTLERAIEGSSENNRKAYADALDLLDTAVSDTRRVSHDLMPSTIERYGLIKALEDFVMRMSKLSHLKIEIDPDHVDDHLSKLVRLNIYRIIQELVQNVIKHAKANALFIKIRKYDHTILLTVDDDGQGFEGTIEQVASMGIGLKNVMARVKSMNGSFHIESKKTKGTHIDVSIPILLS